VIASLRSLIVLYPLSFSKLSVAAGSEPFTARAATMAGSRQASQRSSNTGTSSSSRQTLRNQVAEFGQGGSLQRKAAPESSGFQGPWIKASPAAVG